MKILNRATSQRSSWSDTIRRNDITGICLIIDEGVLRVSPEQAMEKAISAGLRFFQYRSKKTSRRSLFQACSSLAPMARRAGAIFLVNDHADIAAAVDADGVHLGQDDLPIGFARKLLGADKVIGVSTHSPEEARAAEAAGADYIGFGPLFPTTTKDAGAVQGLGNLRDVKQTVSLPVIAIGGINHTNAADAVAAGADGIAVISAILASSDSEGATRRMLAAIQKPQPREQNQGGSA